MVCFSAAFRGLKAWPGDNKWVHRPIVSQASGIRATALEKNQRATMAVLTSREGAARPSEMSDASEASFRGQIQDHQLSGKILPAQIKPYRTLSPAFMRPQ